VSYIVLPNAVFLNHSDMARV